jgi:hypothetical protein
MDRQRRESMVADLSARERLRLVAESAKRIRELLSSGDQSFMIELIRIASDIELGATELEREFEAFGLPNLSPGR